MATIERHAGNPYVDGETLDAADLETDFNNILDVVNGSLESSNLATAAGVVGTQLAAGTILTANMAESSITQPKISDGSCSSSGFTLDSSPTTPLTETYAAYATHSHDTAAVAGNVLVTAWIELTGSTTFTQATNPIDLKIRRDDTTDIVTFTTGFYVRSSPATWYKTLHINALDDGASDGSTHSYTLEAKYTDPPLGTITNTVVSTQIIAVEFRR
jgi:hypothetical protein